VCLLAGDSYCGLANPKETTFVSNLDSQFYPTTLTMLASENGQGQICFRCINDKYLSVHPDGSVAADGEPDTPATSFIF